MRTPKPKLTQALIDREGALPCPPGLTHCEYPAGDRSGLYLDVRPDSEIKTFFLRYKDQSGKSCSIKIGRSSITSLKEAKLKIVTIKGELAKGQDPQSDLKARRQVLTWDTFFNDYYLKHAKQHKRSWGNDEEMHRLRISKRFGNVKLNKITRHAVQQWLNELRESGLAPSTCSHYGKLIRQALNLAVEWELLDSNPVSKIKLFSVDNREERLLTNQQLQKLMAVLDTDKNRTVCLVIKFLFFTGARVNEVLHARWAEVDRKNRTFSIQATNSKSRQRRSLPLSNAAITVLDQLESEGKSEWLFTSVRGGRLSNIGKVWARIRKEADLEGTLDGGKNFRLHDARHAAASAMVSSGQSLYAVQKILGHSDPSVTQRYAHLSTEALRDAADSIGLYVENALKDKKN